MTHSPTSAPRISRAQSRPPAAGRPAGHHRARPPSIFTHTNPPSQGLGPERGPEPDAPRADPPGSPGGKHSRAPALGAAGARELLWARQFAGNRSRLHLAANARHDPRHPVTTPVTWRQTRARWSQSRSSGSWPRGWRRPSPAGRGRTATPRTAPATRGSCARRAGRRAP
jgi:hypothetical protein